MYSSPARPEAWIKTTPAGLYCEPGGFHIDPLLPVPRAIVTHGHGDHARPGNERVLATPGTIAIVQSRYGELAGGSLQPIDYGEPIAIDGVGVRLLPAGHVLGSAQIVLDYRGARGAQGPHRAGAARGDHRPLVAAAAGPARRNGVGLDAGAPARQGARRRAAACDLRSRRLGRADGHDR